MGDAEGTTQIYKGEKIRARRIDTENRNKWEVQINGRAKGRRGSPSAAMAAARMIVDGIQNPDAA